MSNNVNYNHNSHDHTDNNDQRENDVHGGEFRNGRKAQVKNNNSQGDEVPNEYVNRANE